MKLEKKLWRFLDRKTIGKKLGGKKLEKVNVKRRLLRKKIKVTYVHVDTCAA